MVVVLVRLGCPVDRSIERTPQWPILTLQPAAAKEQRLFEPLS